MSFRRDKQKAKVWGDWLKTHHDEIIASGLPDVFFITELDWWRFLEHGSYADAKTFNHPCPYFDLENLNEKQLIALGKLVAATPECEYTDVARWLRKEGDK